MPFDWVFHQILNERLSKELGCCVVTWNLSQGGASNQWIARTMVAVPLLDPDIVITNFTFLPRREFIDVNGFENRYMPSEIKPLDNPRGFPMPLSLLNTSPARTTTSSTHS